MTNFLKPTDFVSVTNKVIETSRKKMGIVPGFILTGRYVGVIRPKGYEPYEGELLLIASSYGTESALDLVSIDLGLQEKEFRSIDSVHNIEPGTFRYYIVLLQSRAEPRPKGSTLITSAHLDISASYDTVDAAVEAFKCWTYTT